MAVDRIRKIIRESTVTLKKERERKRGGRSTHDGALLYKRMPANEYRKNDEIRKSPFINSQIIN